jgi:hypothetical protein
MATIYNPNGVSNGLVLYYDAGNLRSYPGSGTTLFDLSGNGISATGGSAISGGSLSDTQTYTTSTTSILNTDTHSIFMMLQINGTNGSWSKIFGYEPSGTDRSPGVWRWPSSRRLHWRYDPGNTGADFSVDAVGNEAGTEFTPNVWYYVGVTKNGSAARSYTNGTYLGQQTVATTKTAGNAAISLYPAYNQNTSKMALIQIYNRVLTDQEVSQNFNAVRDRFGI